MLLNQFNSAEFINLDFVIFIQHEPHTATSATATAATAAMSIATTTILAIFMRWQQHFRGPLVIYGNCDKETAASWKNSLPPLLPLPLPGNAFPAETSNAVDADAGSAARKQLCLIN